MKSWREHAHLFANGKFSIWDEEWGDIKPSERKIIGYNSGNIVIEDGSRYGCMMDVDSGTLIARKIEDMTDEEIKNTWMYEFTRSDHKTNKLSDKEVCESVRNDIQYFTEDRSVDEFLYLLSIGVYPFDQSAFNNGEVIDIKTL